MASTTSLQEATASQEKTSLETSRPILVIPGPVENEAEVLEQMTHFSESHVGMPFVNIFGDTLSMLRRLFLTENPASQPFVISGSGTLGWDQVASNLAEPDDEVLVLHTGYFADSFADCFAAYGVKVTQLKALIGQSPPLSEIELALQSKQFKLITITHVDTSTAVLSNIKEIAKVVKRVSPHTLIVVDGVCSVGSEEIRFDDWDLDVVMTASQKGIGVPAGLSILMASERAIEVFNNRKRPVNSYFASWKNWLPVMQSYEAKKPMYFATPSPQLIRALHTSLNRILSRSLADRFAAHRSVSQRVKRTVTELGLKQLAEKEEDQSNSMTAIYLPNNLMPTDILPRLLERGVIFAGGLHKEISTKYIRLGHMGISVTDPERGDIDRALTALKDALAAAGYKPSA